MLQENFAITYNGVTITFTPSISLLEDLSKSSIPVNRGCLRGFCGTCKKTLKSGNIVYHNNPMAFLKEGEILPCISSAISDLEIAD